MTDADEQRIKAAVEQAKELPDARDELVSESTADPSAPFAPEVVSVLAARKRDDPRAFEGLRAQLKDAGVRITALDEAIAEAGGESSGRRPTQADTLVELANAAALFHTSEGTGFVDVDINGHRETWPIRHKEFRRWLTQAFFTTTGGAVNSEALQSVLRVVEATAHFHSEERDINVRVAGLGDRLYLDLADASWRAVEIDSDGWRIVDRPPVRFRRASGMQPLSTPETGGSIEHLRPYLNVQTDADFVLVVSWMLAVLRHRGPYPVLVLSGEQGSAKSTFSKILRALLDPNAAPLRALPREDRDLFIAATNSHVLTFDNVSGLPSWISDTLCRLATGGGFAVRQLYTDQDEVIFDATRPVILNGIEDIVTRPDLADRGVFLRLKPIPEESRRTEDELWQAFRQDRPKILGALLDSLVHGLRHLSDTRLDRHPRMADFARWATACETAGWPSGTFMDAYMGNREHTVDSVIEADPVASTVRSWMADQTKWSGTASDLLTQLNHHASDAVKHGKTWPSTPRTLSSRLRRAATFLRAVGIYIDFDQKVGRRRTRMITISTGPDHQAQPASASSAPSAPAPLSEVSGACGNSTRRTVERHEDAAIPGADGQHTPESPWKREGTDSRNAADATDEHIPPHFCRLEGQAVTAPDGVPEAPGRIDEGASTMTDATRAPQHTYDIRAPDGTLEARHVRKDPPLGRKHVSWQLPNGTKGLGGRAAKTWPLYRSERLGALKPGAMVIVCAGEQAADALVRLKFEAVGTVTGSNWLHSDEVLRTFDQFEVVVWPDADVVGHEQAARVLAALSRVRGSAAGLFEVDPGALGLTATGADAADWKPEDDDGIDEFFAARRPWTPPRADNPPPPPADELPAPGRRPGAAQRPSGARREDPGWAPDGAGVGRQRDPLQRVVDPDGTPGRG